MPIRVRKHKSKKAPNIGAAPEAKERRMKISTPWALILIAGLSAAFASPGGTEGVDRRFGVDATVAEVDGLSMEIFSYRPSECAAPAVLVVFHGNGRGAESYRDSARTVADRSCFTIYAPLFDEERFPSWRYHRAGVIDDGQLRDPEVWTIELVGDLIDWIRDREGAGAPIYLFGHSAGGQFLSRYAAYAEPRDVERIVLANPSTYVLPTTDEAAPYGFGGLPEGMDPDPLLQAYLAAPVTVYLGSEDTGDESLTRNAQADRQGDDRLDRGRQTFDMARAVADERGWTFGWSLIEAEGVGHTARGMLESPAILPALGFEGLRME